MRASLTSVGMTRMGLRVLRLIIPYLVTLLAVAGSAAAEEHAPRLVVLHRDGRDFPAAQRDEVDRVLQQAVAAQVRFAASYASQVPLEDIELAAGCSAREADCTQRIAASVGADWLLVRELTRDRQGRVFLTLIAHDGPGALVTRRVVAQLDGGRAHDGANSPAHVVPILVERLYPKATVLLEEPGPRPGWSPANIAGWSAAGAGASLLIAGTTMGVLSHRDHREYDRTEIKRSQDVDHADALLSRSQQRAQVANGLLIGGATAGLAGAATLLWSYLRPSTEVHNMKVALAPARSGVSLHVGGSWRGGL